MEFSHYLITVSEKFMLSDIFHIFYSDVYLAYNSFTGIFCLSSGKFKFLLFFTYLSDVQQS